MTTAAGRVRAQLKQGNLKQLLGVGLLSTGMLAFELTLTRLFALAEFYHFAFLVISLALLGNGAAGTLLTVQPALKRFTGWWAIGFGLATAGSFAILNLVPFDSYAIAWDLRQVGYLLLTLVGAAFPFLFSGLVVGGLLALESEQAHQVYAANLIGSALGSVIVLPVLVWVGGEGALFLSAALGLGAALLLVEQNSGPLRWLLSVLSVVGSLVFILLALGQPDWTALQLSPYKSLSQVQLAADTRHVASHWSLSARIDVVESDHIHIMPGLSDKAGITIPPDQFGLTLDGDNLMPITVLSPEDVLAQDLADHVPLSILFQLAPETDSLLILEPGGGWDTLMALAGSGSVGEVTVVEPNRQLISLLQNEYAGIPINPYADQRIQLVTQEGRTYVRRTGAGFDAVTVSLSDSFHPVTSGAFTLSEDYRYTEEAMVDYLEVLNPGGFLIITRWLQTPPTESLRVLATIDAALRDRGSEEPYAHIAAFRSLRTMTFVVRRDPLSDENVAAIRAFAADQGYDLVWLPGIHPEEINRYSRLPEPVYYNSFVSLLSNPRVFIHDYHYDIRPPTDDRPFFFHYFRWRQTPEILQTLGTQWQPFGGSGYLLLVLLLVIVTLLATLAIFAPLIMKRELTLSRTSSGIRWRVLLYFSALGLAFLFIEIPLAQRFILYIGQPVSALSVVLFAVLLFSGLGSLTAPRWDPRTALLGLVLAAGLTPLLLRLLFAYTLQLPLAVRIAFALGSLLPLSFFMGIPFARGLTVFEELATGVTPWAWAVNGSTSVISAVIAVMLAMSIGFTVVLWLGAAIYALALAVIWSLTPSAMWTRTL